MSEGLGLEQLGTLAAGEAIPLPRAASLMLWSSAYRRGDIGPDDAIDAALGAGHRRQHHTVRALPAQQPGAVAGAPAEPRGAGAQSRPAIADLFDWVTHLKQLQNARLALVLPVPGRVQGLFPPPTAINAALAAEQAITVSAQGRADHTLIPSTGTVDESIAVTWQVHPSDGRMVPPPVTASGAREELLRALRSAARSTVELDLVPEEQIAAAAVPQTWSMVAPPRHVEPSSMHLLVLASRVLLLTDDELSRTGSLTPPPGSIDPEAPRLALLRQLHDASRSALADVVTRLSAL